MARCPHCGRPAAFERCGVFLTPLKAAIFDAIKRAGEIGVTATELLESDLYRDRKQVSPKTIKSHVFQINEQLEETDWIIASRNRCWHVRRRRVRSVA